MRHLALATSILIFTRVCAAANIASISGQPVLLATDQGPPAPAGPAPFTELVAAYPFGMQTSLGVAPGGGRVYVAEGGAINTRYADLEAVEGGVYELPETSPYSILRYTHSSNPAGNFLFVAGGTSGLWEAFGHKFIDAAEYADPETGPNEVVRKRCIDIAIVERGSSADPLLCAIFTARNDSPVGPSELRLYTISSVSPYTIVHYRTINLLEPTSRADAAATALVAVPGDSQFVYVALGTAWLHKVDLDNSTHAQFPSGQILPSPPPEMRDLAFVSTTSRGPLILASLDSDAVWECKLDAQEATLIQLPEPLGAHYAFADRIAAVTNGTETLVGVGLQKANARFEESAWSPAHLWGNECLHWPIEPAADCPPATECKGQVRFYRRDASGSWSFVLAEDLHSKDNTGWRTLEMRYISSPSFTGVRSYECTREHGTKVREIVNPFSTSPTFGSTKCYIGIGNGSADGVVSLRNPGFTHLLGEHRGAMEDTRLYITPPPADILPMNVDCTWPTSPCSPPPGESCPSESPPCSCAFKSISPFGGALVGSTNWLAEDSVGEWFFSGTNTYIQVDADCTEIDCFVNSCGTQSTRFWKEGQLPVPDAHVKVGWNLTYMTTAGLRPHSPTWNPSNLSLRWYQFASPTNFDDEDPGQGPGHNDEADTGDLLSSSSPPACQRDPRSYRPLSPTEHSLVTIPSINSNTPVLLHGVRSGSKRGYKIINTSSLLGAIQQNTCAGVPGGIGEPLTGVEFKELATHLEVLPAGPPEFGGGCLANDCCFAGGDCNSEPDGHPMRALFSSRVHIFPIPMSSGVRYVSVVTAGMVMTLDSTECDWRAYSRKPMVLFYDVTDTGDPHANFPDPTLLAVGIGENAEGPGHAFAAAHKTYSSGPSAGTYVFVADATGKMMVFDVSGDTLFNPPPSTPLLSGHPLLRPRKTMHFPRDPRDGHLPNCIDVGVDGDYAYCAIGREGLAIVDISNPLLPSILTVLETSGITEGVFFRKDELGREQMLVGDLGAGLRLYGRPTDNY